MDKANNIPAADTESCPKCGNTFLCSKSNKCWCYEYDIPPENRDYIEAHYNSCLCPDCLKFFSLKKEM
ncbi:cysteine-rich CWC family protein [candidate division KSB1 bacterium]